jgi:hypothetical protein
MNTACRISGKTLISATLGLTALLAFQAPPGKAQTQEPQPSTPEVQQLKERLQLLEQTVKDLKTQLGAIEARKNAAPAAIIQADYSTAPVPAPAPDPSATSAPESPAKPQDDKKGGERRLC